MEYLPVLGSGEHRSRLEAQQRAAGLQRGDVSQYWHGWITHPITGQDALEAENEEDKEFFTAAEKAAVLTEQEADDADWLLDFEEEVA